MIALFISFGLDSPVFVALVVLAMMAVLLDVHKSGEWVLAGALFLMLYQWSQWFGMNLFIAGMLIMLAGLVRAAALLVAEDGNIAEDQSLLRLIDSWLTLREQDGGASPQQTHEGQPQSLWTDEENDEP